MADVTRMTEAQAIHDIVRNSTPAPFAVNEDGAPLIALPDGSGGLAVQDLSPYAARPHIAEASPHLRDVKGLVGYLARFQTDATVAFADWRRGEITAVIDYHAPDAPSHMTHRATLKVERSIAWRAWSTIAGKMLDQTEFGEFLEEHAVEVAKPDAADLMDVVLNLEATKKVSFRSAQRLSDGLAQISYQEEDQTKGGIRVPERLTLRLSIYEGTDPVDVPVLLRFRVREGVLRFKVVIPRIEELEREAFEGVIAAVEAARKLPIYRGVPGF